MINLILKIHGEIKHVLTEEGRRIAVYYSHKEDPFPNIKP
jgi:hypothetical protein